MNKKQRLLTVGMLVPLALSGLYLIDGIVPGVFVFWLILAVVYTALMFVLKGPQ